MALTADKLLKENKVEFTINDGTRGFSKRYLQAKNFSSFICQTGVFEQHNVDIPQVNLINLHGSVYWQKHDENILVDYKYQESKSLVESPIVELVTEFSKILNDPDKAISDIESFIVSLDKSIFDKSVIDKFWDEYNQLPIVNPTKWKFHETVFEEHYYQMLRALSYEFEKPNSIFITFGFSFADEHILNLCKRSLSNPTLQLFVCCFNTTELAIMETKFAGHKNVEFVNIEGADLNFVEFNKQVFTLTHKIGDSGSVI